MSAAAPVFVGAIMEHLWNSQHVSSKQDEVFRLSGLTKSEKSQALSPIQWAAPVAHHCGSESEGI